MFPLTRAKINDQRKYVLCISLSSIFVIYRAEEKQYGNIQIQPLLMRPGVQQGTECAYQRGLKLVFHFGLISKPLRSTGYGSPDPAIQC